jgi:5-methyltetrahydropteroyltriglutamate--homocysteine methyltransferase
VEMYESDQGIQFKGGQTKAYGLKVTGPIRYQPHPFIEDFRSVAAEADGAVPKQTIPSPSVLHFRGGRRSVDTHAYPTMEGFFADLGAAYADAVADFAAAGCRYLQLDEVNIAYLCDPEQIEGLRARGEHVEGLLETYADLINAAIARRPAEMTVSMHLCRGNFRSMHIASGGYDPVAEVLFNRINVDAYFMEYDTERAGTFAPLRFLPKGKTVVLGLVTSKTGALEAKDALKRRIEEASKHVPVEQLAISPQCGFASTEEGNLLTVDEQWAKLALCVEVAREVWGEV